MSVKCGYTIKYYPLLSRVFNTSTDEEFKSFLEEYFIDPDSVYRMFLGGISTNPTQTSIFEPKKISSRTGWEVKTDSKSAQQFILDSLFNIIRWQVTLLRRLYLYQCLI